MGWLTKFMKGSNHKISEGQYQAKYGDERIWAGPSTTDAWSDFETEDVDHAIALSLAEEDQKGKKVIDDDTDAYPEKDADTESHFEEDEQLAKALHESLNIDSAPRYDHGNPLPLYPYYYPSGYRICAGCNAEIGHGRFLSCMENFWHPECFRCHACNLPISDYEFSMSENRPYHKSCYKEKHHPRCDVCKNFAIRVEKHKVAGQLKICKKLVGPAI